MNNCFSDVGEQLGDLTICDRIKDKVPKGNCYADIAEDKNDPNICDDITRHSS